MGNTWETVKDRPEIIGEWLEAESRDVNHSPSYYAADYEILRTKPGRYPVKLESIDAKPWGRPYYVAIRIDADRIDGRLYSGFGGLNFASRELPQEPKPLSFRRYAYELQELVAQGVVVLNAAGLEYLAYEESRTQTGG